MRVNKLRRLSRSSRSIILVFLIILLTFSTLFVIYYFPEKYVDNSVRNINEIRGVSGLSIQDILWDEKGDLLVLALDQDISIVDSDFNLLTSLNYQPEGPHYIALIRLLAINEDNLIVNYYISSLSEGATNVIISWNLVTYDLIQ